MDQGQYGYHITTTDGRPHGPSLPSDGPLPPQAPFQHHGHSGQYAMAPTMGTYADYPPAPLVYAQPPGSGPPALMHLNILQKTKMRAIQACEECRLRKQKCDEGRPCSPCVASHLDCRYRDKPPVKKEDSMEKVVSMAEQLRDSDLNTHRYTADMLSSLDGRLGRLEQQHFESSFPAPGELSEPEDTKPRREQGLDDHRTAPHKLISLWPSVRPLLEKADIEVSDGYVMEAEDRGVICLYGRGEGSEEQHSLHPGGSASPASSEDSFSDAPLPQQVICGRGLSAYAQLDAESRSHPDIAGGLKPSGTLGLDELTINALWESYLKHIHVMHPFLDKARTRRLIEIFIDRYCPGRHSKRSHTIFAVGDGEPDRLIRQQRSNDSSRSQGFGSEVVIERLVDIERSPSNAVILLVLALGKICAHEKPLPGLLSPTQTAQNIDVIPGLAYYTKAADILGDHCDGDNLIHAQMFLLAGLYKGQLARVTESMSWISMAGRVVQTLLDRYNLYNDNYWTAYGDVRNKHEKGQRLITDMRQNLIVLASWTCLQLESDILAELRLPSSGIQNIENLLLMPHNLAEEETLERLAPRVNRKGESYNKILLFYTAQMFLRKRLNQVHRQLYGPDSLKQPLSEVQAMLQGHEAILDGWRGMLPPDLKWVDDDPPPPEILSARLRAKYWGARYVINRPFLDYALHIMPHVKDGQSVEEVALDVHRNPRDKADIHLFKAISLMGEGEVWAACRRCIEAAMESTTALDGVADRLVVTNVHGTAHAQFGNMLVLSATWHYASHLRELIDQDRFQTLLDRTIGFLRKLSPISPTCEVDCAILEGIQRVLFGAPPGQKSV